MDNDTRVPLVPVVSSNYDGTNSIDYSNVRNSPGLSRGSSIPSHLGSSIPTVPNSLIPVATEPSRSNSRTPSSSSQTGISLRLPNIAGGSTIAGGVGGSITVSGSTVSGGGRVSSPHSVTGRPVTTPVNLQRSSPPQNNTVTIPTTFSNVSRSPVNTTGRSGNRSNGQNGPSGTPRTTSATSARDSSTVTIPEYRNTPRTSHTSQATNLSTRQVNETSRSAAPLIRSENIVPIKERPFSPRDETEIMVHGVPVPRETIVPIPLETDSDGSSDEDSREGENGSETEYDQFVHLTSRSPSNFPNFPNFDGTTVDTTDVEDVEDIETGLSQLNQLSQPFPSNNNDVIIRASSPVAQLIIPSLPTTVPVFLPITSDPANQPLINPAPPTNSIVNNDVRTATIHPVSRPPRTRGRQPIPVTAQPTPITSQPTPVTSHPIRTVAPDSFIQSTTPLTGIARISPQPIPRPNLQVSPQAVVTPQPTRVPTSPNYFTSNNPVTVRQPIPITNISEQPKRLTPPPISQSAVSQSGLKQPQISNLPPLLTPSQSFLQPPALKQSTVSDNTLRNPEVVSTVDSIATTATTATVPGLRQVVPDTRLPSNLLIDDTKPLPQAPSQTPSQALPQTSLPTPSPLPVLPPPNVPNYSIMTREEQAQHRANFRMRFGILRDAWPSYHIPDVPDELPLEQVHAQYDIYVRHIHISRDADRYKVYLVILWLLIELFCIKIGLNIGGYTTLQMRSMSKYDTLLIELGESNYRTSGGIAAEQSTWPVEARILFTSLVSAVAFIIIKMLASYTGETMATSIMDVLTSYLTGTPPQPGQILFGGPSQPSVAGFAGIPGAQSGPPPGGAPLPQMTSPMGGMDVPGLLANLGSMFLRNQQPLAGNAPTSQSVPSAPATPRYKPAYED